MLQETVGNTLSFGCVISEPTFNTGLGTFIEPLLMPHPYIE
jgi:hypothetical protein